WAEARPDRISVAARLRLRSIPGHLVKAGRSDGRHVVLCRIGEHKRRRHDMAHEAGLRLSWTNEIRNIPDEDGRIRVRRRPALAIWRERHRADSPRSYRQAPDSALASQAPQDDGILIVPRRDMTAVGG